MGSFKNRVYFSFFIFMLSMVGNISVQAQPKGMTIIRDTEIENTIRSWTKPIFEAAEINPDAVNIVLIQSDAMNAFVAGGSNIFIYTGLIMKTDNPGELIGVIAHETGHIAGGHLIKTREAMERASYESMVGAVLGIGAAIASGDGGAASAITLGSTSVAQRRLLAHSRVQESSADQAAIGFMQAAHLDPMGLSTFMEKLKSEIYMPAGQQSEYVLTHPLVENRIEALQSRISQSPYKNKGFSAEWNEQHKRMKAKLLGFINPTQIPWVYDDRDQSVSAQYARAIASYRNNKVQDALSKMDALLKLEPQNPYFLELKGQMLMDFGRGGESIPYYRNAITELPQAALLRIALGQALIEVATKDANPDAKLNEAIKELEISLDKEPRSSRIHRLLATAYGRLNNEDMAKIHLAEEAVLQRRFDYAKSQAQNVLSSAQEGSKAWLKAKDVLSFIDVAEKK